MPKSFLLKKILDGVKLWIDAKGRATGGSSELLPEGGAQGRIKGRPGPGTNLDAQAAQGNRAQGGSGALGEGEGEGEEEAAVKIVGAPRRKRADVCRWQAGTRSARFSEEAALGSGWADRPAAFAAYRGPRPARTAQQTPIQWVDDWPVRGVTAGHRQAIKMELLRADAAFWKSPDISGCAPHHDATGI